MYEIMIKIGEKIDNFTIDELKEIRDILSQYESLDEFHLKHAGGGSKDEERSKRS